MRVALFITCFNDTLFPNVGIVTTPLLERLGLTLTSVLRDRNLAYVPSRGLRILTGSSNTTPTGSEYVSQ